MSLPIDLTLKAQVAAKDSKIQELEAEIVRLKKENVNYSEGVTANDSIVCQSFASLQQEIKQLVQKWFQVDEYPCKIEKFTGSDAEYFHGWHSKLGKKNQINRVRGIISLLLFNDMLKTPHYGFQSSRPDIESSLATFEGDILKYAVTQPKYIPQYTSWRIQTANWSRRLQPEENFSPEQCPTGARQVRCILDLFLKPIQDQDQIDKRRREVLEDILEVYRKWHKFSLALRLLQDSYKVLMPKGVVNKCDLDKVWVRGSERSDLSLGLPSPVAYTISGALVKYSGQNGTEVMVLNKANVILGD